MDRKNNTEKNIRENKLALAVKSNDAAAFVELVGLYSHIISSMANTFGLPASDFDDLCQEGRIALYRAAMSYDGKSSSFATYASVCIRNSMTSWIKKQLTANHLEREGISLDDFDADIAADKLNVAEKVASDDMLERILDGGKSGLSDLEKTILGLKITGEGIREIAERLGKNEKSVENTLFRARAKVKKYIQH